MREDVLLRFLRHGLIDVDGDDEKLKKLQGASDDLSGVLLKVPAKALGFSLVAFDPEVPEDEPVVQEVLGALSARWPTYVNTISGSPVTIVRGILLAALEAAARRDIRIATAFVSAARNILPSTPVGPERPIWQDLVLELEDLVETRAEEEWATPDTITVGRPVLSLAPIAVPKKTWKISRERLKANLTAAAGPHGENGQAGADNPNPYWPSQNQNWVTHFGQRATAAIADAIDPALNVEVGPIDVSAAFGPLVDTLAGQLTEALESVAGATKGLQRRTALIWWKEALYSPSTRRSYRGLEITDAAALMAFDLYDQCPSLVPLSVTSFLDEAVGALGGEAANVPAKLGTVIQQLRDSPHLEGLRTTASGLSLPEGRAPVLAFLSDLNRKLDDANFRKLSGVSADLELTPRATAVWLFRELQASRIAVPEPPRRRARKTS